MAKLVFDDREFKRNMDKLSRRVESVKMRALNVVADELLRLSQLEVPFDSGHLLQSGNTEPGNEEYLVGYNTPYAAKMHENPQFRFKNGRKGKYLEDPMKKNLSVFRNYFNDEMGKVYAG